MAELRIDSTATLNNGVEMPWLGLGVFNAGSGGETKQAVLWALEAGYRHVDTAAMYRNEEDVGRAVRESGVPRDDVFITTKVWNDDQGYEPAKAACEASLKRLGMDYVDLLLIHWPVPKRHETWDAFVELREAGKARAIGVSNFTIRHLEELAAHSPVVPAVNQVEFSPFLYQKELLEHCRKTGVQLEAWAPLARGRKFDNPQLVKVAGKHGKTPAQVMVRWFLDHEVVTIPKSVHRDRIHENADVFDFSLDAEDLELLDHLDEEYRTIGGSWLPSNWP